MMMMMTLLIAYYLILAVVFIVMRAIGCFKILKQKKVFKPQMYFWNVAVLCELCDKLKTIENETKESEVANG